MRCKDCSKLRGYPFKRSHLVALQATKISATDPPTHGIPVKGKGSTAAVRFVR